MTQIVSVRSQHTLPLTHPLDTIPSQNNHHPLHIFFSHPDILLVFVLSCLFFMTIDCFIFNNLDEEGLSAKLTHRTMQSSPSSASSSTPSCCPFLVIHGDWQWPSNHTKEQAFVRSVEKGRALHLRITDSGHHSYSDIGMVAPPVFVGELTLHCLR